jgi:hypothetical protein
LPDIRISFLSPPVRCPPSGVNPSPIYPDIGLRNAESLAAQLDKTYSGAAASLREGLEEI